MHGFILFLTYIPSFNIKVEYADVVILNKDELLVQERRGLLREVSLHVLCARVFDWKRRRWMRLHSVLSSHHTHLHTHNPIPPVFHVQVVQTLNPWAAVVPANFSRVPLPDFLGVNEGRMGGCVVFLSFCLEARAKYA